MLIRIVYIGKEGVSERGSVLDCVCDNGSCG